MDYYVLTPISFALRLFEVFTQFQLVLILLDKKICDKKHFSGTLIFSIIIEIVKLYSPQYLNGFISLILGMLFIMIYFKGRIGSVSLSYLLIGIVVAVIDCIVLFAISIISGIDKIDAIVQVPILYVITSLMVSFSMLILGEIAKKVKNRNNFVLNRVSATGLVNVITTFVLIIPNLVMILYYYDDRKIPLLIIIINICAIVAMFFVSTYNTKKGFELITAEQELITQRTYNKTLQNLVDGLRTFKHDYNNALQTMYGYIQLNNMEGLKKYFTQLLDESRAITALDKLNPDSFKNPSLYGLITAKYEYSKQNNVNINFEMYGQIEDADMQIYDLTRVIGIFLDNAIEAATLSEKKLVNLMVRDRKGYITIEISNTYLDTGLKMEEINKKGVSSKGENRGLGLYKVKEILGKYSTVKHETTAQNGMFKQKLVINKVIVKV